MPKFLTAKAKPIIFGLNVPIALFGVGLIVFGLSLTLHGYDTGSYGKSSIEFGGIVFVMALLGCCLAVYGKGILIKVHGFSLGFLGIIQIALAILLIIALSNEYFHDEQIEKNLENIFIADPSSFGEIQRWQKCCGVRNIADYPDPSLIPGSCCGYEDGKSCKIKSAYKVGCTHELSDYLEGWYKWIDVMLFVFIVIELCTSAFTVWASDRLEHYG